MKKLYLTILLVVGASSAHAQMSAKLPVQPNTDTVERRQFLQDIMACLAKARPRWARQTLSYPYLGDAQSGAAAEAFSGNDNCVRGDKVDVTFRTPGIIGGLAEYYLRTAYAQADFSRVSGSLQAMKPMNASEEFAFCLAARDPAVARDLTMSTIGSSAEAALGRQLAGKAAPCVGGGMQISVDVQSLRALMATALYRGVAPSSP
ncbi:MAG: hypothetical protein V4530_12500 [Pseudomonadota bacterium]